MQNETVSIPSYNIADIQDQAGTLDFFMKTAFQKMEKVAPAKIVSYDRQTNRAVIQILNYSVTSVGDKAERKPLSDIPVAVFGAGNFCFSLPVKEDDIGIIVSCDGDISIWKKILNKFTPATEQKHRYKDGIFFPLIINNFTFAQDDENSLLLSSTDGATKISIAENKISIQAADVEITGKLTINNQEYVSHTHSNGNGGAPTGGVII